MNVRTLLASTLLIVLPAAAPAEQVEEMAKVEIKTQKIAGSVSMLVGRGGNIGVSMGQDGAFLIDDEYAPLTPKIKAAVAALGDKPLRFLLNTHWHGDHTGGNKDMGEAGVLIVAHENVRRRMSTDQFIAAFKETVPASPQIALPVVTFTDAVTFHLNGDEIRAFHVPPAHTDGDAIIQFRTANVVHMGDTFFNGLYPFIDVSSGGNIDGMIGACDIVLKLVDAGTKIIPGHGPLGTREDLAAYRAMLVGVRAAIASLVAAGRTLEQAVAAHPTAQWDAQWGQGFLKPDEFVSIVYGDIAARAQKK
jgi:cyclase